MADAAVDPKAATAAPRRWRPERKPRTPWLIAVIAVLGVAVVIAAVAINMRTAAAANDRPRVVESQSDATVDGAPSPAGRLRAGAEVAAGAKDKLRLQWDDGSLIDLGAGGKLALRATGKGVDLRDGIFGALVSPQDDGRRFVVGTPFGEVSASDGQFSVILSSVAAVVHAQAGHVRIRPSTGAERELPPGETARLEQ
jgi:ferric-dicitrate binding protein FerR (iron transport regulator)